MGTPIAIAFSDLHLHSFNGFSKKPNDRLIVSIAVLHSIFRKASKVKIPVLFAGDFFHDPLKETNATIVNGLLTFDYLIKTIPDFIGISGNHDLDGISSPNLPKPYSWMELFTIYPNSHILTFEKSYVDIPVSTHGLVRFAGVPYCNNPAELIECIKNIPPLVGAKNILLLHSDAPGAQTPEGLELKESKLPSNLDKFFKGWDWVLMGHIHKPMQLSNKVYMLGSPIHQTRGDKGTEMGYWIIYADQAPRFISLNKSFPCFVDADDPNKKDDDYVLISDAQTNEELSDIAESTAFDAGMNSRAELANKYCELRGIKSKRKKNALIKALSTHG